MLVVVVAGLRGWWRGRAVGLRMVVLVVVVRVVVRLPWLMLSLTAESGGIGAVVALWWE